MIDNTRNSSEMIDDFNDVTILFADIVNFTAFSNNVQPNEVFALLREVFTEFDKSCLKNKVYKLYTIGDCYVAISITETENRNVYEEARNIVNFAFLMLDVINSVREKDEAYKNFNMRIGIHTVYNIIFIIMNSNYLIGEYYRWNSGNRYCEI